MILFAFLRREKILLESHDSRASSILNQSSVVGSRDYNRSNRAAVTNIYTDLSMQFIQKHWFLASLLLLMAMGFQFANPFETLAEIEWLKWSVVSATMFLMAWPLEFGKLQQSLARPTAPLLGAAFNLILIPLLVWPLAALAGAELGPRYHHYRCHSKHARIGSRSHACGRRRRQRGRDGYHPHQCHLFLRDAILDLLADRRSN
jgi:hypothetical protein